MSTIAEMVLLRVSGDGLINVTLAVSASLYDGARNDLGQNRYSLCKFHLAKLLNGRVPDFDKLKFTELCRYTKTTKSTTAPNPRRSRSGLSAGCICNLPQNEDRTFFCPYHGQR